MSDSDKSLYNLRYNQITSNLEAFGGGTPQWTLVTLNNVDPTQVPVTRQINTTAPLQGGGNLTIDRTLHIPQATTSIDGYLTAVDWTTFNNKQTAGNYITGLTGDATASGPGSVPITLATVNGNVGTFTYASITVNAKGLITSASSGVFGSLTDVGTDGITVTGGTGAVVGAGTTISQHVADSSHNGYLSQSDWSTFNGKLTSSLANSDIFVGNASNIATAVPLSGDATLANTGALTLATVNGNVGSFTNASITVNAKGLITAASSGTAPVTSVSGTANQITSTGGATPVLSIANPVTFPGAMTAGGDLAMASRKITNLANGTTTGDAISHDQVLNAAGFTKGAIVQIVTTTDTSQSTSSGNNSFTATTTAATITPNATMHKIRITINSGGGIGLSGTPQNDRAAITIKRGATDLSSTPNGFAEFVNTSTTPGSEVPFAMSWIDSPASTSALTYTVYIKNAANANSVAWNNNSQTAFITLEEIAF